MLGLTVLFLLLLFIIGAGLWIKSIPVLHEKTLWKLVTTRNWNPFKGDFGFLTFILSTLYVTFIAVAIALPLSLLASIYLSEYATLRIRPFFSPVVYLLAGGVVLAISRAFGETMAVLMVCGNFTDLPKTIFDSCYPLPALIANNYGEMMSIHSARLKELPNILCFHVPG